MSKRLYIIGNGFDKAHGIPSGYLDFRIWFKMNDNELLEDIEDIWENNTQLWNDFERNLGVIDYKSVEEKYKDYKLYEALMAERSAPIWHISYYSETDKERIFNFIKNNRISLEKFRLIEISDILMK